MRFRDNSISKFIIKTHSYLFARPISLKEPGAELPGVHTLRSPEDGAAILEQAEKQHVVIVGTSFIGQYYYLLLFTYTIY